MVFQDLGGCVDEVRTINARIAKAYDAVVYDPAPVHGLDADGLLGFAALFGAGANARDVLDLGCGTGVHLERLAGQLPGRLVGVDISREACARARARLAPYGDRAEVHLSDALDQTPGSLGLFDLVFVVGVLYVTPPAVQAHLLDMVAASLKPGGVAIVSYYAGAVPLLRANLHRTLRAARDPNASPHEAVATARNDLARMRSALTEPGAVAMLRALDQTVSMDDTILFHEVLNEAFDPCQTSSLQARLAPQGVNFIGYLGVNGLTEAGTSQARSLAADRFDFAEGGYRYAAFMRRPGDGVTPDPRGDGLRWRSRLVRQSSTATGEAVFYNADRDLTFTLGLPLLAAFVDALVAGPASWSQALAAARRTLPAARNAAAEEARLVQDFMAIWRYGVVTPLRAGLGVD